MELAFDVDLSKKIITDDGQVIIGDTDTPVSVNGEFLTELLLAAGRGNK